MATAIHEHIEYPLEGLRISWGGIWAGALTVLGILLFLTTLGLAVGITAVDPTDPNAQALGTGAAVWGGLSLLIALFFGGMVATRLGLVFDKTAGAFEGVLVWVLSFLVTLWLASSGVRLVAGGISSLFSGVTQTISAAGGPSIGMGMQDLSSGNVDQILARLNDPETARTISTATGVPEQQVSSTLSGIAQRVEAVRDNPQQVAQEIRQGTQELYSSVRQQLPAAAQRVQQGASKTAWITFAAMVISLIAAVGGAMLGRKRAVERIAEHETATISASSMR